MAADCAARRLPPVERTGALTVIRISKQIRSDQTTLVQIHGRLDEHTLPELDGVLGVRDGSGLILDLSGLVSMDLIGRDRLVVLRDAGATLIGGSLYINKWLEEAQP